MNKTYSALVILTATSLLSAASDESRALTRQTATLIATTGTPPSAAHSTTVEVPSTDGSPYKKRTITIPSFCTPLDGCSLPAGVAPRIVLGSSLLATGGGLSTTVALACSGASSTLVTPLAMLSLSPLLSIGLCVGFSRMCCKKTSCCEDTTYTLSCSQNSKDTGEGRPLISGHESMDEGRDDLDSSASSDGSDVESE